MQNRRFPFTPHAATLEILTNPLQTPSSARQDFPCQNARANFLPSVSAIDGVCIFLLPLALSISHGSFIFVGRIWCPVHTGHARTGPCHLRGDPSSCSSEGTTASRNLAERRRGLVRRRAWPDGAAAWCSMNTCAQGHLIPNDANGSEQRRGSSIDARRCRIKCIGSSQESGSRKLRACAWDLWND